MRGLVLLVGLVGCKDEPQPKPSPPVVVARDAGTAVDAGPAVDAGAVLQLASTALPVATIDGASYYAIDAHVTGAAIDKVDLRAWSAEPAKDAVGIRPATRPAPPWSLAIGKELAAYTKEGAACPVRVTGLALLDRASAEMPAVLGRLEARGCVPAIVSGGGAPKLFAIADPSAAEQQALQRAVATLPGWADYEAAAQRLKRSAERESVAFVIRTSPPIGVVTQRVTEQRECGEQVWSVGGAFELRDGAAPVLLGELDLVERPRLALDTDADGKPELLYGAVEAWDHGQSGGVRFAALRAFGRAAVGDVGLSYYVGCD